MFYSSYGDIKSKQYFFWLGVSQIESFSLASGILVILLLMQACACSTVSLILTDPQTCTKAALMISSRLMHGTKITISLLVNCGMILKGITNVIDIPFAILIVSSSPIFATLFTPPFPWRTSASTISSK